jgi:hypothetical protein
MDDTLELVRAMSTIVDLPEVEVRLAAPWYRDLTPAMACVLGFVYGMGSRRF